MHKKLAAITTATALVGASVLLMAGPASAHTPELTYDCDSIEVTLTGYPSGSTINGVLDGVNLGTTTFSGNYSSGPIVLDPSVAHEWTITIDSSDGDRFDKVITGQSPAVCLPVVPPKPEPVVTVKTGEDGDCETGIVTRYETPFTADWTLVDNVWVQGEPVAGETIITTRPATATECPVEEPPVVVPPVEEPPVVTPPAVEVPPVVTPPTTVPPVLEQTTPVAETLPETGADFRWAGLALFLIVAGAGLMIARKHRTA